MNNVGAIMEFKTFAEPPNYIHYLGEAIGECTELIPLRSNKYDNTLSKLDRWNEIRAMFRDDKIILKMMAVEPGNLHPNNFYCVEWVQKSRQDLVALAKDKRSAAEHFY